MIVELLAELNAQTFQTEKDAISWLRKRVDPHHLVVKFECTSLNEKGDIGGLNRVILSKRNNTVPLTHPITRTCAGLVLEHDDGKWRVLAVPPPMLARNASANKINIAKYEVSRISDGTVVTAYSYGGEWRFSTANGYDVTDFKWIGELTFGEAINEAVGGKVFDTLNEKKSYTFGFSHPAFHFFNRGAPHAWFIQSALVDSKGITISRDGLAEMNLPRAPLIENPTIKDIISECAVSRISGAEAGAVPCLGFILRRKVEEDDQFDNILVESPLLQMARNSIYKLKNNKVEIDHTNRLRYSLLRLFLREGDRTAYIKYFPQHKQIFDEYAKILSKFARKVLKYCKENNNRKNKPTDPEDVAASSIAALIINKGDIQVFSHDAANLVYDFILNVEFADIFYKVLIK